MLCVIDEFTRRCLAIVVARWLRSDDVLQCLTDLFVGKPRHGAFFVSGAFCGCRSSQASIPNTFARRSRTTTLTFCRPCSNLPSYAAFTSA
jgi:hypothetical protein